MKMPITTSHASRARTLAIVVLLALAACSSPTSPAEVTETRVSTDREAYVVEGEAGATVRFAFHNGHPGAADVTACGGAIRAVVERESGGEWSQYAGGLCPANLVMTSVRVPTGAAREGVVQIGEAGRYRLRVEYGAGEVTVVRRAISPAFSVVE